MDGAEAGVSSGPEHLPGRKAREDPDTPRRHRPGTQPPYCLGWVARREKIPAAPTMKWY